jgi:hypothetical protein
MGGRITVLAVVLAGAVAVISTTASPARDGATPPATEAARARIDAFARANFVLIGETAPYGMVNVFHRRGERRARTQVSLHGLEPGLRYRVVGSTRRCSQRRDTSAGRVFGFGIDVVLRDDLFMSSRVTLNMPLTRARTISVFRVSNTLRTLRCSITGTYNTGTGVLT